MFDHLSLGVRDLAAARAFYDAFFAPLGAAVASASAKELAYGPGGQAGLFYLYPVSGEQVAGLGAHLAFTADSRVAVDEAYRQAIAHGATAIRAVVPPAGHQACVAAAHVLARVGVGPAERHDQEGALLPDLLLHVHAIEEVRDAVVRQHLAVEDVDSGLHGGGSADAFIERGHRSPGEVVSKMPFLEVAPDIPLSAWSQDRTMLECSPCVSACTPTTP